MDPTLDRGWAMDGVRPHVFASLDPRTKLARGRWRLVLYPDAGEAVATFQSAAGQPRSSGSGQPASDTAQVAARRARRQVRLYCAANRLAYLWTATYAPTEDARHQPHLVRQDVRQLFRRLRRDVGRAFPYIWTTEWHSTGHGFGGAAMCGSVCTFTSRSASDRRHGTVAVVLRMRAELLDTSPSTSRKISGRSTGFTATRSPRVSSLGRAFYSPLLLTLQCSLPRERWAPHRFAIGSRNRLSSGPVRLPSGPRGNEHQTDSGGRCCGLGLHLYRPGLRTGSDAGARCT
jgi:hypothetical protein